MLHALARCTRLHVARGMPQVGYSSLDNACHFAVYMSDFGIFDVQADPPAGTVTRRGTLAAVTRRQATRGAAVLAKGAVRMRVGGRTITSTARWRIGTGKQACTTRRRRLPGRSSAFS